MTSRTEYILGQGYAAASRLNAQHLIWREQLGYVVHPEIPIKENMKVADVGAGTGIWLIETSKVLPQSAMLHGYDIDVSKSPPKQWLLRNVSHFTWDAFSDVPAAMVEQYDVVHVGIVMFLIANNDPLPILSNMIKLLSTLPVQSSRMSDSDPRTEPGGCLQWDELDWASKRIIQADPSIPSDNTRALLDHDFKWEDPLGSKAWVGDLAQIYASQGLINMSFERFETAPEYLRYDTDKVFTSYEEFSRTILDPKGGNEGERLRGLVEKAYSECQKGVAITADMVVAVARKPQTSEVTLGNQN